MYRRHRAVHFVSLLAIIVSLFSPVLSQPVVAQEPPEPATPVAETPVSPTPVVPEMPVLSDATCGEDVVFAQVATAAQTEGVTYNIGEPDAAGEFTITATLTDAENYTWADSGLDGWTVSDNQAEMTGTIALCPGQDSAADDPEDVVPEDDAGDEKLDDAEVPGGNGLIYIDPAQSARSSSQVGTNSSGLTLTYSVSPTTPVEPGTLVEFTSSVHAAEGSENVGITNTLPAGVTFSGFSVSSNRDGGSFVPVPQSQYSCAFEDGIATCDLIPGQLLIEDATILWTVHATVNAPAESEFCQSVRSSSVQGNWSGSPGLTAELLVACPELNLTATHDIAPGESVGLHEPFTYTVTVSNAGTIVANGFEVQSQLPSGVVLTGDSPITHPAGTTCTPGSNGTLTTITCSGTSVPVGEGNGLVFQFSVMAVDFVNDQIDTSACGSAMFVAAGTVGPWDPDAGLVNVPTEVACVSSVDYTLEPLETPVEPGGTVGFVQTVHNTGNTHIITPGVFDPEFPLPELPAGAEWTISVEIDGETYETLPSIGYVKPGSVLELTLQSSPIPTDLTLPAPEWCTEFTYSNEVEFVFTTGDRVEDAGSATVDVICSELLSLTVTDGMDDDESIGPNDEFTYTVTVTNTGINESGDFSFTSVLPAGINPSGDLDSRCTSEIVQGLFHITCSDSGVPLGADNGLTFDIPVIAVEPDVCGQEYAENQVSAVDGIWAADQDSASASTAVECISSFTFSSQAMESPVVPGETIGFELTVHNDGPVRLTDVSIDADHLTELPEGNWNISAELNGEPIDRVDFTGLDSGETLVVTVVSDAIPDDITVPNNEWCKPWSASFTATAEFIVGSEQTITDSASLQVNCSSVTIDMDVNSERIELGGQVEYTITVTNRGNTVIEPMIVAGLSLPENHFTNWEVSTVGGDHQCLPVSDGSVVCYMASLDPEERAVVTITADALTQPTWEHCGPVESVAGFEYMEANAPTVMTSSFDLTPPNTAIYSDPVTTQLDCQPGIEIEKNGEINTGEDGRVDADDTIIYTIDVTNSGNMPVYDIVVTDDLAGLEWDKDLTIAELQPGERETFTAIYTITQADLDAGELVSAASVSASLLPVSGATSVQFIGLAQETEPLPVIPDSVTNSIVETTVLSQEPGIELEAFGEANTGDDDVLDSRESIEYTFTVTNTGNVTLTDIDVIDEMDGVTIEGDSIIASLSPGEEAMLTASYVVTEADAEAGVVEMCAHAVATDPNNAPVNASDDCVSLEVAQLVPVPPTPTPDPVTPEPATPDPTTPPTPEMPVTPEAATPSASDPQDPQSVTRLPETGSGNVVSIASVLWAAAVFGVVALGVGGLGVRRSRA